MESFILILRELFALDPGKLSIDTDLKEIKNWDSLSMVNFVAIADVEYNKILTIDDVLAAETVRDLYDLVRK